MSRPPVSKVTPLPMSATFGASSRPQEKSTIRGASAARAPDRMDKRKVRGDQVVAAHNGGARAELLRELDGLLFKRVGTEHIGRRIDEIAPINDRRRRCARISPASTSSGATRRGFGALSALKRS